MSNVLKQTLLLQTLSLVSAKNRVHLQYTEVSGLNEDSDDP